MLVLILFYKKPSIRNSTIIFPEPKKLRYKVLSGLKKLRNFRRYVIKLSHFNSLLKLPLQSMPVDQIPLTLISNYECWLGVGESWKN